MKTHEECFRDEVIKEWEEWKKEKGYDNDKNKFTNEKSPGWPLYILERLETKKIHIRPYKQRTKMKTVMHYISQHEKNSGRW